MSYCTRTDVERAIDPTILAQLTDDVNGAVQVDARIEECIGYAAAEIDGYIGGVVTLPYTEPSELLERICVQMALYQLFLRRGLGSERQAEYNNCQQMLRDIAAGKMALTSTGGTPATLNLGMYAL